MPVTFSPSTVKLEAWSKGYPKSASTADTILRGAASKNAEQAKEILQSTFPTKVDPTIASSVVVPQRNGLVHTVLDAYNHHHALVLRPDDVWICILTQFNFFLNGPGRAEALRSKFVAHDGKKELVVYASGTRYTVDFGALAHQMTDEIHKNVVDPELRAWILPTFSTTTPNDTVVGAVTMMATFRAYFEYRCCLMCGIPLVRLEGEREDWENILARIEKLKEYGLETTAWYHLLRPVLSRFARAFDETDFASSDENTSFWQRVAHVEHGGSGPSYLSGWITAFSTFSNKGEWMGNALEEAAAGPQESNTPFALEGTAGRRRPQLILDGVKYHSISTEKIPSAVADVPVKLNDNGAIFDTVMVAGLVGSRLTSSKGPSADAPDTLSPVAGWWIYISKTEEELRLEAEAKSEREKKELEEMMAKYRFSALRVALTNAACLTQGSIARPGSGEYAYDLEWLCAERPG